MVEQNINKKNHEEQKGNFLDSFTNLAKNLVRYDQHMLAYKAAEQIISSDKPVSKESEKVYKLYKSAIISAPTNEIAKNLASEDMQKALSLMPKNVAAIYLSKLLKHERYDYNNIAVNALSNIETVKSISEIIESSSKYLVNEKQVNALSNILFDSAISKYKEKQKR
ncbi:MAG: hypothetical protein QXD11_01490 [Candidatus Micrarchaeaceae archaeon]